MSSGVKDIQLLELKDTILQLNNTIREQSGLIENLQKLLEERNAADAKKDQIISNLEAQLEFLKQKLFGSTSESRKTQCPGQLSIFDLLEGEEEQPAVEIEPEIIEVKAYKKERKPKATYDQRLPILFIDGCDSVRTLDSRLDVIQCQLFQAAFKRVLLLVMVKVFEFLIESLADWVEVLPSMGKGTITVPLVQHHPQLEGEITIAEDVGDSFLVFGFLHFRQDILEFVHMDLLVALHIADMDGLRGCLCIGSFIKLLRALLHLCVNGDIVGMCLAGVDLFTKPVKVPLLRFSFYRDRVFPGVQPLIHSQPPHFRP